MNGARATTRGPRPGRGRGVRTRGGSAGASAEVPVDAGRGRSLGRGHGRGRWRGAKRPHASDDLKLIHIDDLPIGVPMETPLTQKRKRSCQLHSSSAAASSAAASGAPPAPAISVTAGTSNNSSAAHPAPAISVTADTSSNSSAAPPVPAISVTADTSSNSSAAPPAPAMFVECHGEELAAPVPPPQNQHLQGEEIDLLLNYGSEEESDSDEEVPLHFAVPTNVCKIEMETPRDSEEDALLISETTLDDCAHVSTSPSSGPTDLNFLNFEWRAFPDPPINPDERRETFSDSDVGPTIPYVDPYGIFVAIWGVQIMEYIALETNRYAQELAQQLMTNCLLGPFSRIGEWRDTTTDELYTYFAIVLAMGNVVKTRLESYWSANADIFCTPGFSVHMSLRRFQMLSRCLHFNQNERLRALSVGSAEAKLFKIQPVVDHLNNKFQELYNLQQNIALDESLLMWKGRTEISQHIPNKAAAVGIKTYEICESQTGYLWRFDVHAHKRTPQQAPNVSHDPLDAFTPALVLKLLKGLENKGHTVWMDNFYNSPALARKLKTLGFDCVGTLRTNRRFVPQALNSLTNEHMRPGTITGLTSGDVDVMVWRDRNRVATISTYHGRGVAVKDGVTKPILILDYNVMMGGVDKKDQMLAAYPLERKRTKIWYKKFFRRLLNVSVLNSYIICKTNSSPLDHHDFREKLILTLLDRHSTRRQDVLNRTPQTLSCLIHRIAEFPYEPRWKQRPRRVCIICKKRVHTFCFGCDKTVCIEPCFVNLHRAM